MNTTRIIATATTLCLSFSALILFAQGPPGPSAGGPIDGGITILIAGAAAMGYKKMKERKQAGNEKGENR